MTDITVVGAGPAGLMACEVLAHAGLKVRLMDHKLQPGRKFLLAGRGGLNLTHSEPLPQLLGRYGAARGYLAAPIDSFPPNAVTSWCHGLGIETFIGSSGRVFPKGLKASPLLRNWLRRLGDLGVTFEPGNRWSHFSDAPTILALGGASWPEMGSDAAWVNIFAEHKIAVTPFVASNSRQRVAWSQIMVEKHAGAFVKNVALSHHEQTARGDIVISKDGIEGTPVYALSASLRDHPEEPLLIDLKPDVSQPNVDERLTRQRSKDSFSTRYRKALGLQPAAIALLKECKSNNPKLLVVKTEGPVELRRAISSAGGVSWDEIDENFCLRRFPNTQVIGEMLDWDAPTGGYLLQACFAMGYYAAKRRLAIMNR